MITRDLSLILADLESGELPADSIAEPRGIFMVEPSDFRLSEDSGADNQYMDFDTPLNPDRALEQYHALVSTIRDAGIQVTGFPGNSRCPDGIFPNNAFATVPGRIIVGRMYHPSRQHEADREDIRRYFQDRQYQLVDLSQQDCVAELTGTLIIDRARRLGFCGLSNRVNLSGVEAMNEAFNLRHTLYFDLADSEYHTNVVMSVLAAKACVLHEDSIRCDDLAQLLSILYDGRVLFLDQAEKVAFAGNCIALSETDLFMSQTGVDALAKTKRQQLESWGFTIHSAVLDEIEKAGGSLRCMVAEIY